MAGRSFGPPPCRSRSCPTAAERVFALPWQLGRRSRGAAERAPTNRHGAALRERNSSAESGCAGNYHYNAIASWRIVKPGEASMCLIARLAICGSGR